MRDETYQIRLPGSSSTDIGAGAGLSLAQSCRDFTNKVVEISGAYTGPVAVKAKVSNAWVQIGTVDGSAAPGLVSIPITAQSIQIDVTGLASGSPAAAFAGLNARADG